MATVSHDFGAARGVKGGLVMRELCMMAAREFDVRSLFVRKIMMLTALALMMSAVLTSFAQDVDEETDADTCVGNATVNWTLPQTLDELKSLRDAAETLIEQCTPVPTTTTSGTGTKTMFVNSGAGQVNMRYEPRLTASVVTRVAHGDPVESLGEVAGDEFGNSTIWHHVRVEDGEGYIHSLLLSATRLVSESTVSAVQGTSAITVTWHEGHPSTGTCKDNVRQGRIYLGCGYEDREKVKDHLWGLPCNHPVFDAFGYSSPGEGYWLGIAATGKHARWRDDDVNGTQCALHS